MMYKITEAVPGSHVDILVWDGELWRPGYWETRDIFVVYSLDDLPRATISATYWVPQPPRVVNSD